MSSCRQPGVVSRGHGIGADRPSLRWSFRSTGPGGADDDIGKVSQPDREEAQRHRQGDVAEGLGPLAGPQEVERLQAEGGEGRVAPPHTPTMRNARASNPGSQDRPEKGSIDARKPMRNDPATFTAIVPQGERIPERSGN